MNRRQFFARVAGAAVATQVPLPAPVPDINAGTYAHVFRLHVARNMATAPVLSWESVMRGMAKLEASQPHRRALIWDVTSNGDADGHAD